jgi:pimeloyl-ACP methyl ester carboxylesterase
MAGPSGASRYLLRDYVEDMAAFLRDGVREPAVLYGHSLGGEVAVMLAAEHPGLVRALIVWDAPLSIEDHPTEEPGHRAMNVLWHDLAGRQIEEIVPALKTMPLTVPDESAPRPAREVFGDENPWFAYQAMNLHLLDPGVLAAVLDGPAAMLEGYDPDVLLPMIACPMLLLQAELARGGLLRDEEAARGLRLLRHGRHVRLTGIGHELHGPPSQVPAVLDAIAPFLEQMQPERML